MNEVRITAAEHENSPVEDLVWYAFSLDDARCDAILENRNRLWISYQAYYDDMRDDYVMSDAMLLH